MTAATHLVWSNCYDIGLVFSYCGEKSKHWSKICVAIRKLIKSAGLDYMTDTDTVYKVSLKMDPRSIAIKHILQAGIKLLDTVEITANKYRVPRKQGDIDRPFWFTFLSEFNHLPMELRKFIIDNLDIYNKSHMEKIKDRLRTHFIKVFDIDGPITNDKRSKLLNKNLYSRVVIKKRKREYELVKENRKAQAEIRKIRVSEKLKTTPVSRRRAHSNIFQTPPELRRVALCKAPKREPSAKMRFVDIDDICVLSELFPELNPIEITRECLLFETGLNYIDRLEQPTLPKDEPIPVDMVYLEPGDNYHVAEEEKRDPICATKHCENTKISQNEKLIFLVSEYVRLIEFEKELTTDSILVLENILNATPDHSVMSTGSVLRAQSFGFENNQILDHLITLKELADLNLLRPPETVSLQ